MSPPHCVWLWGVCTHTHTTHSACAHTSIYTQTHLWKEWALQAHFSLSWISGLLGISVRALQGNATVLHLGELLRASLGSQVWVPALSPPQCTSPLWYLPPDGLQVAHGPQDSTDPFLKQCPLDIFIVAYIPGHRPPPSCPCGLVGGRVEP